MSFRDRDASDSSRNSHGINPDGSQAPDDEVDLPIRIAVVESLSGSNSTVYRVTSGRQCSQSPDGAAFICPVRLPGNEMYLELRSPNRELRIEAASIVREDQTPDGRWRYDVKFIAPPDRVDRYEFD